MELIALILLIGSGGLMIAYGVRILTGGPCFFTRDTLLHVALLLLWTSNGIFILLQKSGFDPLPEMAGTVYAIIRGLKSLHVYNLPIGLSIQHLSDILATLGLTNTVTNKRIKFDSGDTTLTFHGDSLLIDKTENFDMWESFQSRLRTSFPAFSKSVLAAVVFVLLGVGIVVFRLYTW